MTVTVRVDRQVFRDAVAAAIRAPSVYNAQPWRFRLRGTRIEVRADPGRQLPVADPHGWAARVACGAAVTNLRLALLMSGLRTGAIVMPDPGDPDLIAVVSANGPGRASPHDRDLYAAIDRRFSNRRPFFDAPVPAQAQARIRAAASGAGTWMVLVSARDALARLAETVRSADAILRRDERYLDEMRAWTGANAGEAGISTAAAGVAPAGQDLLAMRDFGGPERAPGRDFESDPLLAVLGTVTGRPADDVAAGMALQRVLLTATNERLATSLLSQPIEIPQKRAELRDVTGRAGCPQIIIRVGYGQPGETTPRRPVEHVIDPP